jgi:hypothetical protein
LRSKFSLVTKTPSQQEYKVRIGIFAGLQSYCDISPSEAARQKKLSVKVMVDSGRFGPSCKKEAAARRFGNYGLWMFKALA